jgi:antitoxin VapB
MPVTLIIDDPETDRLLSRLADLTGESRVDAIKAAVRQRLEREQQKHKMPVDEALAIARRIAGRIDDRGRRTADEIIGYDEHGLPR